MFNLIKIEYYDDFQCAMSACPENCCDENWTIRIDETTYRKYADQGIPDLDKKISSVPPHVIIKDSCTGRCPFITGEGMCTLHATYGEAFLSDTCKSYPRFATDYGPVVTMTLGLSCPVVADRVVNLDHVIRLREEVMYEHVRELKKPYLPTVAERQMKRCISLFHDDSRNVIQCLEECLKITGKDCDTKLPDETVPAPYLLHTAFPILEKNIAVSYLFEHLMLESLKAEPDYGDVTGKCFDLLMEFRTALSSAGETTHESEKDVVTQILYRLMRQRDH